MLHWNENTQLMACDREVNEELDLQMRFVGEYGAKMQTRQWVQMREELKSTESDQQGYGNRERERERDKKGVV